MWDIYQVNIRIGSLHTQPLRRHTACPTLHSSSAGAHKPGGRAVDKGGGLKGDVGGTGG